MHPAPAFRWDDRAAALEFVRATAFAHLFAATPAGPRVAHPIVMVAGDALRFHLSNGNALTPHLAGQRGLASIGRRGAYVSPNWYVAGANSVPTWNYLAVEIEGRVRRLDADELAALLEASAAEFEPRVGEDWRPAKMDPARLAAMSNAITGFELTIETLRATRKLSQNKGDEDVRGVVAGMEASGGAGVAALIRQDRGWA